MFTSAAKQQLRRQYVAVITMTAEQKRFVSLRKRCHNSKTPCVPQGKLTGNNISPSCILSGRKSFQSKEFHDPYDTGIAGPGIYLLFCLYNEATLLAPVTDFPFIRRFNRIKIIVPPAISFKTLRAISTVQFVTVDGQMAMPAPQHIVPLRQQDKSKVLA